MAKYKSKTNKKLCKKLKGFSKEEMATYKEYTRMGFKKQGLDELGHSRFFKKESAKRCK